MGVQVIDECRTTSTAPDAVFELLLHAEDWPGWSSMRAGSVEQPSPDGPGGVGEVRTFRSGRTVSRERVVASERPHHFAYVLLSGLPIRDYRADVTISSEGGTTTIRWRSTFRGTWPGSGPLLRFGLRRFIRDLLDDLVRAGAVART